MLPVAPAFERGQQSGLAHVDPRPEVIGGICTGEDLARAGSPQVRLSLCEEGVSDAFTPPERIDDQQPDMAAATPDDTRNDAGASLPAQDRRWVAGEETASQVAQTQVVAGAAPDQFGDPLEVVFTQEREVPQVALPPPD